MTSFVFCACNLHNVSKTAVTLCIVMLHKQTCVQQFTHTSTNTSLLSHGLCLGSGHFSPRQKKRDVWGHFDPSSLFMKLMRAGRWNILLLNYNISIITVRLHSLLYIAWHKITFGRHFYPEQLTIEERHQLEHIIVSKQERLKIIIHLLMTHLSIRWLVKAINELESVAYSPFDSTICTERQYRLWKGR